MKKLFSYYLRHCLPWHKWMPRKRNVIRIATDNNDLILQVAPNGRLYQAYLGDKLLNEKDINNFSPYVKGGSDGSVSTRGCSISGLRHRGLFWTGCSNYTMMETQARFSVMYLPSKKQWQAARRQSSNWKTISTWWKSHFITSLIQKKTSLQDVEWNQICWKEVCHHLALCFDHALFLKRVLSDLTMKISQEAQMSTQPLLF